MGVCSRLGGAQSGFFGVFGWIGVFLGAHSVAVDAKGRMAIPARYRDALTKLDTSGASEGGRIVITRSPDGALMLFPRDTWEPFAERVAALPMAAQWHRRLYLGHATEVDMDAAGRVLISAELRRSAGIAGEVKLLGMGNHVEIWDLVAYEQREMAGVRAEQSDAVRNFVV